MKKFKNINRIITIATIMGISLCSSKVYGFKIVLDPGHGGSDPGSINTTYNIEERNITMKLTQYLKTYLEQYDDVNVILTHDESLRTKLDLPERGMAARNNNADLFVSLHFNASENINQHGAEAYVSACKLLPKYNFETAKLANGILNNLSTLGIYNNGVKTRLCNDIGPKWEYSDGSKADYYGVIRYAMKGDSEDRGANLAAGEGIPAILIESCYIRGTDIQFIDSDYDLQKMAEAEGKAIVDYYGFTLKGQNVTDIFLDRSSSTMAIGESLQLLATVEPANAKDKSISWGSSNEDIAKVDQNGNVTAISIGDVEIIASANQGKVISKVNISVEEPKVILHTEQINLMKNDRIKLLSCITPKTLQNAEIIWESSDNDIVTVDNEGNINALKEGECIVTAKLSINGAKYCTKVIVNEPKEGQYIKFLDYKNENGFITGIGEQVSKEDFLKNMEVSDDLEIVLENTYKTEDTEKIATNTKVMIVEKDGQKIIKEFICLIYGDVNGDARISAMDYALIKNHIINVKNIDNPIKVEVANVNGDTKISAMDYALIKNHILGVKKIENR